MLDAQAALSYRLGITVDKHKSYFLLPHFCERMNDAKSLFRDEGKCAKRVLQNFILEVLEGMEITVKLVKKKPGKNYSYFLRLPFPHPEKKQGIRFAFPLCFFAMKYS